MLWSLRYCNDEVDTLIYEKYHSNCIWDQCSFPSEGTLAWVEKTCCVLLNRGLTRIYFTT